MTNQACPISRELVNEIVAKIISGAVFLLSIFSIFWFQWYVPFLLAVDFFLRGFLGKPSLLKFLAILVHEILGKKGKMVNAGPKKFAMKIGFWVSLLMTLFAFFDFVLAFQITSIFLVFASGLELFFDFCLGCKVFPYWQMFKFWFVKK